MRFSRKATLEKVSKSLFSLFAFAPSVSLLVCSRFSFINSLAADCPTPDYNNNNSHDENSQNSAKCNGSDDSSESETVGHSRKCHKATSKKPMVRVFIEIISYKTYFFHNRPKMTTRLPLVTSLLRMLIKGSKWWHLI
jgi:hypothetical protein